MLSSNGKGLGLNHPGVEAQEAVIRKAYEKANLDFTKTGYFECHGTGTPVGDRTLNFYSKILGTCCWQSRNDSFRLWKPGLGLEKSVTCQELNTRNSRF